jgi:hypothetical protein
MNAVLQYTMCLPHMLQVAQDGMWHKQVHTLLFRHILPVPWYQRLAVGPK